jgi:hypothetical protein
MHREIRDRLDTAHTEKVKKGGQAEAQKALDSVIAGIWQDIRSGKLPLYGDRDVII